ncbi:MAG: 8-oxo-dGTP diphosphatase [Clostridia bacterium]|nr:8-oxo-dGTP diphosphatase [Clostridia bacterium]
MKMTTLCYISCGDDTLMLHRTKKKNDENAGKWVGIGGKFEEGESPEDCLTREVYEETGVRLEKYRYRGIVTFVSDEWGTEYMHLFTGEVNEKTMHRCSEGDLEWINTAVLDSLPMWEGDRVFFDLIRRDAPFFSLKLTYRGDSLVSAVLDGKALAI